MNSARRDEPMSTMNEHTQDNNSNNNNHTELSNLGQINFNNSAQNSDLSNHFRDIVLHLEASNGREYSRKANKVNTSKYI